MKYTQSHEWIEKNGEEITVGITDHAQKELGEIVHIELPKVDHRITAGEEVAVLESTKAAVDLYSPASGTITAVNTTLTTSPDKVNAAPETDGWLYKLTLSEPAELETLMDDITYRSFIAQ